MTITIGQITRPTNCGHYQVTYTVNGGATRTKMIHTSDITGEPEDTFEHVMDRLRTYCKENSLTTFVQIRNALEGRTFIL